MAIQVLTPTQFAKDGPGLNITPLLATPTGVTLQFANSGKEILLVSPAATAETVTVDIGVTILGQAVADYPAVTLTSGDIYAFGPFDSPVDMPGTNTAEITLSTITSIEVALVQMVGTA